VQPKISYIFSKNASWDIFYELKNQSNLINDKEILEQSKFGTFFNFNTEKGFTLTGGYSFYNNNFKGNQLAPVAFQMYKDFNQVKIVCGNFFYRKILHNI